MSRCRPGRLATLPTRAALAQRGHFGQIAKALHRIHVDFHQRLDIDTLAQEAGRSHPTAAAGAGRDVINPPLLTKPRATALGTLACSAAPSSPPLHRLSSMASTRPAGVLGQHSSPGIQDGTLAPFKSPAPGVSGTGLGAFSGLSPAQLLGEVIRRAIRMVPGEAGEKLMSLLSPTALAVLAGTLTLWAASHAVGVGEAVDLLMLGVGFLFIGHEALDAISHLGSFVSLTLRAKSERDLDAAAHHLADAIAILGVDVIVVFLTHGAGKAWKGRYRPTITADPALPPGEGSTNLWGDVEYSSAGAQADVDLVRHHEMVHSFLSPKLQFLRTFRARMGVKGYANSDLLKYIEEALAESYAQLRVNGIKGLPTGIRFPIANGYVTLRGVLMEAAIVAGAMTVTIAGLRYVVTIELE
jgi:hypothetical protein